MRGRSRNWKRLGRQPAGPHPRASFALLAVLGPFALLGLFACGEEAAGPLPPNLPPVTFLSVQAASEGAALDTVSYSQALRWWGSDPDGRVVAYLIRWDSGWAAPDSARRWPVDPSWIVTEATTDTFVLQTGGTYAEHTFSVRALDDAGAPDPTGRTQRFQVANRLPQLAWSHSLPRPARTLPAVAFAWKATDADGPRTVARYLYWLTRAEPFAASDTFATRDTLVAVGPAAFGPAGARGGAWTLHCRAVDESGGRSAEIAHTWQVEEPAGEYLLIDGVSSRVPGFRNEDDFFRAMMDSTVAGNYHIWELEESGGFRNGAEVEPLLSLFRGVVWYGGLRNSFNDPVVLQNLQTAEASGGLRRYLEGGGRFLLCAHNALGDSAGLSRGFSSEALGIREFFLRRETPDIGLPQNSVLYTELAGAPDSLLTTNSVLGAEFFLLEPDVEALFRVPPGFLARVYPNPADRVTPDQSGVPAVLGVLSTRKGVAAVTSFLPSRANGFQNRDRVLTALFRRVLQP